MWRHVERLWRQGKHSFGQLERLAIKYLKQVPGLEQYAKRPFVTYLVASVLAAPFVTILVPLLALSGRHTAQRTWPVPAYLNAYSYNVKLVQGRRGGHRNKEAANLPSEGGPARPRARPRRCVS